MLESIPTLLRKRLNSSVRRLKRLIILLSLSLMRLMRELEDLLRILKSSLTPRNISKKFQSK